MFNNIPDELKVLPQWVNWQYKKVTGKKDTKVPLNPANGREAKANDADTWGLYDVAVANYHNGLCDGIGFMLSEDDPYAFIDLDDAYEKHVDGTPKHEFPDVVFKRQNEVLNSFKSYAEFSPSGRGLHIICKGSIPAGRKRSSIEMYSNVRFMTMTGNVYRNAEILDENQMLNALWAEAGKCVQMDFYDGNAPQTMEDQAVIDRALAASNGDKFKDLVEGDWRGVYPSQSEADLAYINILAFYTQNREQLKRIFRASHLGRRDKRTTIRGVPYLDYMINKSFDRMLPPIDLDGLKNQLEEAIAKHSANHNESVQAAPAPQHDHGQFSGPTSGVPIPESPTPPDGQINGVARDCGPYTVPPGLVGDIAQFIYQSSPRPVPEISLASALGLMAGICGRAFNVSATGLNQYILLLAQTGRGKEALHGGINRLMSEVAKTLPAAYEFIGPVDVASPQALNKQISKTPSFVSIVGEFGLELQRLSAPNAPDHKIGYRKQLLNLYNKSGQGSVMGSSIFADADKNLKAIQGPAFSMLGECTPETFFGGLDDRLVNDGLLPRFTIIEYRGIRVPLNPHHAKARPNMKLVEQVRQLCQHAMMLNNANKAVDVELTAEAQAIADRFDKDCDARMNPGSDGIDKPDVIVNLWNRAHIKAMKLAATIAIGCNVYQPVIDAEMMQWAINISIADSRAMTVKFESGDVGANSEENKQMTDMRRIIKDFVTRPWSDLEKYLVTQKMHGERILPKGYITRRLTSVAGYKNDRMGANFAINKTIKIMIDLGDLVEVTPQQKTKLLLGNGQCYMIANLSSFGLA